MWFIQVLIGAFRRLPIREKNEVLVAAHPMVSSLLAPNNSRDFGKILTVTFNMIVSSKQEHGKVKDGGTKVLPALLCLSFSLYFCAISQKLINIPF